MKKMVVALALFVFIPAGVFADDDDLNARIKALEAKQAELYHSLEERRSGEGTMSKISEKVSMHGTIEVESSFVSDDRDGNSSDIVLATVELGFEAKLSDKVEGHVLFLYEEDDTPFDVDEGTITLTAPYGFSLTVGKMYVPFGMFNSHFISDPMTLEIGETNETALLFTYGNDTYDISFGTFNGDTREAGDDNRIDDYVASLNVNAAEGVSFGVSYISDIADSDADWAGAGLIDSDPADSDLIISDTVAGYHAYLSAAKGPISIEAEYLAAADDFKAADVLGGSALDTDRKLSAFNLEVAFSVNEALEVAVKLEGSEDIDDLPEDKYGVTVSYGLYEGTTVAAEYMNSEYRGGQKGDAFTLQLALEF